MSTENKTDTYYLDNKQQETKSNNVNKSKPKNESKSDTDMELTTDITSETEDDNYYNKNPYFAYKNY